MIALGSLKYYARRPITAVHAVGYKLYELTHPDEPWISQGAIRFCEGSLNRNMAGFEWGSGRSTAWFAERLGSLTSIEHELGWFKIVQENLNSRGIRNVTYRLVPLNHPPHEPNRPVYNPIPDYVAAIEEVPDGTLDFAVVDGHYRQACILAAIPKLKPAGLFLVDDTDWLPLSEWGIPTDWDLVHQSRKVMSETTIWRKPKV